MPLPHRGHEDASAIWQAQQLRLTVFLSPSAKIEDEKWWDTVVGEPPRSRTVQQGFVYRNEGIVQGNILTLSANPSRVDWVWTPSTDLADINVSAPSLDLGPWQEKSSAFEKITLKWLAQCPPIIRIAFGTVVFAYTNVAREGYEILADYLPSVNIDIDNSRDLSFQINRPRQSITGIPRLSINRLSQWNAAYVDVYNIPAANGVPIRRHAALLTLDISSPADYEGELPHDRLVDLFREAIGLASEIIVNGDIP